ncbi:MAG: conjugal transfer protein TraX [Lachnospiraceae bacterium]|nr:conjugal transfer protein TraX [Lachnospiraceae bacterium]
MNAKTLNKKNFSITSAVLKNIAYLSMLIDHFSVVVFLSYIQWRSTQGFSVETEREYYSIGRAVGRVAFVLFAFMAAEGFRYTHSKKNYLLRLGVFALLSEIPFDLAIYGKLYEPDGQNVYFTLFLGVLALLFIKNLTRHPLLQCVSTILCCVTAAILSTDYMFMGVLLIVTFYLCRKSFMLQCLAGSTVIYFGIVMVYMVRHWGEGLPITVFLESGMSELYGLAAFVLIYFYDGRKGRQLPKACYYLFYPAHLLVLYGLSQLWFG